MTPFQFVTLSCATWYLSYALTQTHGPLGIFERLRNWRGGRWHGRTLNKEIMRALQMKTAPSEIGAHINFDGLLDCIICTSVWIAFALCMASGDNNLIDACAVAGLALFIHRYSGWWAA